MKTVQCGSVILCEGNTELALSDILCQDDALSCMQYVAVSLHAKLPCVTVT